MTPSMARPVTGVPARPSLTAKPSAAAIPAQAPSGKPVFQVTKPKGLTDAKSDNFTTLTCKTNMLNIRDK